MKTANLALFALAAASFAHADSMVKPGLWELHITKQVMDGKDMTAQIAVAQTKMQEQIAKMSPAQRKQMEQMMGGQAMPMQGGNHRLCISPEMAKQDKPVMPPDAKCQPSKFDRSGNTVKYEFNCSTQGHSTSGKGESVTSGDTITSHVDMVMTDARGTHSMVSESQMKFIGSDCQGLKPIDQAMKELQSGLPK